MGGEKRAMSKGLTRDKIVKDINTTKGFRRAVRYRGLTVMEVYTSYWGPCACVFNKLQTIYQDYKGKSMPIFLIYKKNQLIETVEGVNTPVLERLVQDNAPSKDELAAGQDDPDSADEEDTAQASGTGGKRRASLSVG